MSTSEPTTLYYVKKPSGVCVKTRLTPSSVIKARSLGWILSLTDICVQEPTPNGNNGSTPTTQLSSNVLQIINALESGEMLYPDWFNNNIGWVKDGHINEETFLAAYFYEVEQGRIHPPIEPEILLSAHFKISFTNSNIDGFSSSIPIDDYQSLNNFMNDNYKNIVKLTLIDSSTNQPISTLNEVLNNIKDLLTVVEPILLSAHFKISFTNPNIDGFLSSIPIDDYQSLNNFMNDNYENIVKLTLIDSSTNQPISTLNEVLNNIKDLLTVVEPIITDNMVTQQVINFNIVNGRAIGSIKFVATNNFNSYYYGKNIVNVVNFKEPNGATILTLVKENRLNFTETERTELIHYDEDMQGNTRATVESFVWLNQQHRVPFSKMFGIEISEAEPPKPITSGFMGAGVAGAIAGLILIGFIADHKRGK